MPLLLPLSFNQPAHLVYTVHAQYTASTQGIDFKTLHTQRSKKLPSLLKVHEISSHRMYKSDFLDTALINYLSKSVSHD